MQFELCNYFLAPGRAGYIYIDYFGSQSSNLRETMGRRKHLAMAAKHAGTSSLCCVDTFPLTKVEYMNISKQIE